MQRVLVTEASGRNVVCVVRSLARKGIQITCADSSALALSFFSRYCHKRKLYPSPQIYPDKWTEWLEKEIKNNHYDMVLPIGDACFEILSKQKKNLSKYTRIPVADYPIWSKARDKAETLKIALKYNIPCPKTCFIENLQQVLMAGETVGYPLVIKPRISSGSRGLVFVDSKKKLLQKYRLIHAKYPFPMIQEFIPPGGNAFGVFLLYDQNARIKAVFAHKRLREFPLKGGPSTLRESVYVPELVALSQRLLTAMGWYGVAMVEFKEDPRDGQSKLMEVNPRFWGSLPLAILANVDFPHLLLRVAEGEEIDPVLDYPVGVRCRWLLPGDILHFFVNPHRFRLKPSFFEWSKNNWHDDFISFKDPGPTVAFFLNVIFSLFSRKKWKHVFFRGSG